MTLEHVYVREFLFQRLKLLTVGILQHRHELLFKDPKNEKAQDLNQEDWHEKLKQEPFVLDDGCGVPQFN